MNYIEVLFLEYLEDIDGDCKEEKALAKVNSELEKLIAAGNVDAALKKSGEYELAAREAGFIAGFKLAAAAAKALA